jgi:phosphoribosylformylglycinamidine cyclo-ligase
LPRTPAPSAARPHTYAAAGVDIAAGEGAKQRIKALAKTTATRGVLGGVGGFGGLFQLDLKRFPDPVLVSSADGVGTKLKLAFELGIHTTVGADLVNHCVNDIAVQGATPLFFLDYLATGRLSSKIIEQVVSGIATACRENGCALIGGETAQMPGFYADGEYDLAGTIVGAVSRDKLITGAAIQPGDVLLGLPSTGLHTNGYSLARKLFFEVAGYRAKQRIPALRARAGAALMATHRSYLRAMQALTRAGGVSGMAHITGGGITENLPRIFPKTGSGSPAQAVSAHIQRGSWPVLPIFQHLQELGSVAEDEMFRTFNMGIGLICVVPQKKLRRAEAILAKLGEPFYRIGDIVSADPNGEVVYQGEFAAPPAKGTAARRAAAIPTRKPATKKPATRKPATKIPETKKPATRKSAKA